MKLRPLILGICLTAGAMSYGHDFTATVNGQRLYFEITSKTKHTAAVTFNGSITDKKTPEICGNVEIPAKIKHDNVIYEVTAIRQKAFANARNLKGIVIPSGVENIGDFAFENCDSLTSVVFPGNPVALGQGIFFRCPSISNITIGSDWKTIDFAMFRSSDSLKTINIPAKIEKIQGVKKLKNLQQITVDPNNSKFASAEGMLYSKDGSTFYACPRAYKGKVIVKEGVAKVLDGSLIDCTDVTAIDFPTSLRTISFRETGRMKNLEYIVMRAEKPVDTGYAKGEGKFFFLLANAKTQIVVHASAKRAYESALATVGGEYSEKPDGVPFTVSTNELPTKKTIKGVKNFDKY